MGITLYDSYETGISTLPSQYTPENRVLFPKSISLKINEGEKDIGFKVRDKSEADGIFFYENQIQISENIWDNETGNGKNTLSIEGNKNIDKVRLLVEGKFEIILNFTGEDIENEFGETSESTSLTLQSDHKPEKEIVEEFTFKESNYVLANTKERIWVLKNPELLDSEDIRKTLHEAGTITERLIRAIELDTDISKEILKHMLHFKGRSSIAFAAWQDKNDPDKKES